MAREPARHGSNAGYRAEISATGEACALCKAAHAEYNRQFTKRGRAAGKHYTERQVIMTSLPESMGSPVPSAVRMAPSRPQERTETETGTGLTDRFKSALGTMLGGSDTGFTDTEEPDDYIREIDPDPEPDHEGSWEDAPQTDYVINAAGMKKIEDTLGTYLSVVGMTVEMIDPYCGPILAENFDEIVKRWARVIGHYPKAAELFMDGKGGAIFAWIGAIQATWPILYAVYEHHLSKTVRTQDGKIMRLRKTDGAFVHQDATTPPMPDNFQYTAG